MRAWCWVACAINNALTSRVIPSEVENGAAGEAATLTGRPEAERTGCARIKPLGETPRTFCEILRLLPRLRDPLRMTG
jgi:hypothetical protein